MAVKVAINGYGRIGRNVLRALYEGKRTNDIRVMMKPLTGGSVEKYLALVSRDRPETE